ncbi:MAG TPA: hypothetical protein VJ866_22500 [Pyrinomonadaceae bacterium]|nr:hypothetical protein [Pyrinomonadaceae bacterium]
MNDKARELAIQAHLEEFSALRAELLELIKWRENLIFFSLAISGALFSFAFSSQSSNSAESLSPKLALYLVSPLASVIGGLWMTNTWRIRRIGLYIRDVTTPRLNAALESFDSKVHMGGVIKVFEWQASSHRIFYQWPRLLFEWMVLVTTFVLSGVTAQLILLRNTQGSIIQRIAQLDFPMFYVIDWALVVLIFLVLSDRILEGRRQRAASVIVQ